MSKTFFIDPRVKTLFANHGLDSFDALMRYGDEKIRRFVAQSGEAFYVKRTGKEPLQVSMRVLLRGLRPRSAALRELLLLQKLRAAGFLAMDPVAWGERRVLGWPVVGFLVVREAAGREVAALFNNSDGWEKRKLMKSVGRLIGRLHSNGFFQPVRLKDLILTDEGLVLIDRETSKPWSSPFFQQQCRDSLIRALRRMTRDGHTIGAGSSCAFLQGYRRGIAERWKIWPRELTAQICSGLRAVNLRKT